MRILLIIDQFFSANNGMTISARRFAGKLEEHGNEVRIVSTGKDGDTEYLMKKQYIPVFDTLVASQGMTFAKPDDTILAEAIDWSEIVHFLVPFALSHHGMEIAREKNKPFTAAFHVQPENITSSIHLGNLKGINSGIYKLFNLYMYKHCTHIHCPSAFIANQLIEHGYKGKLHVISNGIDPDFIGYHKLPKTDEMEGKINILSIGRLSIEKRQDLIINAVALSSHRADIKLWLAGQGPRKDSLMTLANSRGIDMSIGFYEKPELIKLISRCDLYVHAADAEIEAMACMEAFAGGLVPIISDSKKSATPQFSLDEHSLFEADNPSALAKQIDYWIENEEKREEFGRLYTESAKKYDLDACVRRCEEMFMEAIKEKQL